MFIILICMDQNGCLILLKEEGDLILLLQEELKI